MGYQYIPWLKVNGEKTNWSMFWKKQAANYWYFRDEVIHELENAGFVIEQVKTSSEITNDSPADSDKLFVVCSKRSAIK